MSADIQGMMICPTCGRNFAAPTKLCSTCGTQSGRDLDNVPCAHILEVWALMQRTGVTLGSYEDAWLRCSEDDRWCEEHEIAAYAEQEVSQLQNK